MAGLGTSLGWSGSDLTTGSGLAGARRAHRRLGRLRRRDRRTAASPGGCRRDRVAVGAAGGEPRGRTARLQRTLAAWSGWTRTRGSRDNHRLSPDTAAFVIAFIGMSGRPLIDMCGRRAAQSVDRLSRLASSEVLAPAPVHSPEDPVKRCGGRRRAAGGPPQSHPCPLRPRGTRGLRRSYRQGPLSCLKHPCPVKFDSCPNIRPYEPRPATLSSSVPTANGGSASPLATRHRPGRPARTAVLAGPPTRRRPPAFRGPPRG